MTRDVRVQILALKSVLGRRRYRIAWYFHGCQWTQEEIADHLGISQPTVCRELAAVALAAAQLRAECDQFHAIDAGRRLHAALCEAAPMN